MPEAPEFAFLEVPARIANLAFRLAIPRDWNLPEIPAEDVDFSSPGNFFPLVVAIAPWGAVVLTVAARPGFEEGTLQDWSLFLLDSQGIRPTAFGPAAIGNVQGLAGVGRQQQDETSLEVRFAFFEDAGRLVYFGLLAPELISGSLDAIWNKALESFELDEPQGPTVPVGPGIAFAPPARVAAETKAPVEQEPAAPPAKEPEPEVAAAAGQTGPKQFTEEDFGHYAKADDAGTLDPEHPVNARLRNQGVGFVPNRLEMDDEAKSAKLGAAAIAATMRVAYGWHVIDDGKRTMVLDPGGKIQINLSVLSKEGRTIDQIRDDIQEEAERSYPELEFMRLEDGGIWGLAIRNIQVDGEAVEQVHMLTKWRSDTAMLRARVTSDPEQMRFAVDYAGLILGSVYYGEGDEDEAPAASAGEEKEEEPPFSEGPEWYKNAERLERADRLKEAEKLIKDSVPSLHFAICTAGLYRNRWMRLAKRDPEKASAARKEAADWARTYASFATSGGEGAALSLERDEFIRSLGPEPLK